MFWIEEIEDIKNTWSYYRCYGLKRLEDKWWRHCRENERKNGGGGDKETDRLVRFINANELTRKDNLGFKKNFECLYWSSLS